MKDENETIHSGNGNLRGGGVLQIYHRRLTLRQLVRKVDSGIGILLVLCLATNVTIFTMYSVLHSRVHESLMEYIDTMKNELKQQDQAFSTTDGVLIHDVSTISLTTEITEENFKLTTPSSFTETITIGPTKTHTSEVAAGEPSTFSISSTTSTSSSEISEESSSTNFKPTESSSPHPTTIESSISTTIFADYSMLTTNELMELSTDKLEYVTNVEILTTPQTSNSQHENEIVKVNEDLQQDLIRYENVLQITKFTLSTFALLNAIFISLISPIILLNSIEYFGESSSFSTVYKSMSIATMIFLFAELLYLIDPMIDCSFELPIIIDNLFDGDSWPSVPNALHYIEEKFVCVFKCEDMAKSHFVIQDECKPKLKDLLLRTYAVILLIFIALCPFLFVLWTWVWNELIKDCPVICRARNLLLSRKAMILDVISA